MMLSSKLGHALTTLTILGIATVSIHATPPDDAAMPPSRPAADSPVVERRLPTVEEARGRAKLLHESTHATLQIVHHEYFREDKGISIPAATLKRVFRELAVRQQVELRWLAVNAQAMNVDHNPRNDFERQAVQALGAGKEDFEKVEEGVYRHAGVITLTSDCLKCHLPNRTSTKDRAAALVISMRINP